MLNTEEEIREYLKEVIEVLRKRAVTQGLLPTEEIMIPTKLLDILNKYIEGKK